MGMKSSGFERIFREVLSDREEARLVGGPADGRVEEVLLDAGYRDEEGAPFEGSKHNYVRTDRTDEDGRPVYEYEGKE
jgi:hypothetical protein